MSDPAVTTAWVRAFVDELARAGVEHCCVAPGSRSTPLVMACARDDRIRVWVHLDERCAGFFALGLAKATRRPAAVITTSGTATANLFPAVVEAAQAGVPLLLLTADRPHALWATDANQTIDQSRLYGSFARESLDAGDPCVDDLQRIRILACRAVSAALGMDSGPVHVNFPLAKPLEPAEFGVERATELRSEDPIAFDGRPDGEPIVPILGGEVAEPLQGDVRAVVDALAGGSRGLIVVGPVADPEAVALAVGDLARATGFPLLGDPLSGVRFSAHCAEYAVTSYDLLLQGSSPSHAPSGPPGAFLEALKPDVVLRVGGTPVSASLLAFLGGLKDVPQVRVTSAHSWRDHLGVASLDVRSDEAPLIRAVTDLLAGPGAPPSWCEQWRGVDGTVRKAVGAYRESEAGQPLEGDVLAAVVDKVPEGTTLFVSNSMPVRDLDAYGGAGKTLRVYGNRGASGIDGIVSTAAGIAAANEGPSPILAVVGDVAFYHDMNGLFAVSENRLDIVFVVINNNGGGIFHELPVRDHEPEFSRYFATPHGLDFVHTAELYGLPYRRVDDPSRTAEALEEVLAGQGPRILEVRSDREQARRGREAVREAVRRTVAALS